jgi:RES domain-containing protein
MFANFTPERENTRGAPWNPPETAAIYTSLERKTVLAEAEYSIGSQPIRPRASRRIYRIDVSLSSVIDLSDWQRLALLGFTHDSFEVIDHSDCQVIGGAAEWLDNDGLLVPSARTKGTNLVIFPRRQKPGYRFDIIDFEELPPP